MKTFVALLSALGLIASGATTATAETRTESRVRVDGDNFRDSLSLYSGSCKFPGAQSTAGFDFSVVPDGAAPLGSHAIEWTPTTKDSARGPMTRISEPRTLSALSMYVVGKVSSSSGVVFARYQPAGETGTWLGLGDVSIPSGEGWRQVNAANTEFDWVHYTDGRPDLDDEGPYEPVNGETLQAFAAARGTGPAAVGLGFGCDGTAVLIDALRVATDVEDRTYDFEGYATTSQLSFLKGSRSKTSVTFGRSVGLKVAARAAVGGQARPGTTVLRSKPSTRQRYGTIRRLALGSDGKTRTRFKPRSTTQVRGTYLTQGPYTASSSRVLTIVVRRAVRASVDDRTPLQGQRIVFRGVQRPSTKTKILLQRRQGSSWVTERRTKSAKKGRYRVATTASRVGKSTWRVVAVGGPGLRKGTSSKIKVTTRSRPAPTPAPAPAPTPPPSTGGGSGGSGSGGGSDGGSGGGTPPPPPPPPPSGPLRTQPS